MPVVDLTKAADVARYEQFVHTHAFATATQDTAWSQVKDNWKPLYIYLEENGQIIAAMSILMIKAAQEKMLAYVCKGPVCDPKDTVLVDRLMKEAARYVKEENAFLLRIDPEVLYDENLVQAYESLGYHVRSRNVSAHATIQPRFNMVLDLKGKTEEELLANFHKKTRYNIRLSERKGVITRYSHSIDDLKVFHQLYVTMSERHGITYRPYDYFERMLLAYGEHLRVYLAEHEGDIIAGSLALSYGDKTWYAYGGSGNEKRNLMAPHLLQWEMIKWALEQKKDRYDFGGVFELNDSDGLYRFKEGFCYPDRYSEYIGEVDYIIDEDAYQIFISR